MFRIQPRPVSRRVWPALPGTCGRSPGAALRKPGHRSRDGHGAPGFPGPGWPRLQRAPERAGPAGCSPLFVCHGWPVEAHRPGMPSVSPKDTASFLYSLPIHCSRNPGEHSCRGQGYFVGNSWLPGGGCPPGWPSMDRRPDVRRCAGPLPNIPRRSVRPAALRTPGRCAPPGGP